MSKFLPDLEKASPKSQNRRRETAEAKLEKKRVSSHVGFAEKEKPPPSVNAPYDCLIVKHFKIRYKQAKRAAVASRLLV